MTKEEKRELESNIIDIKKNFNELCNIIYKIDKDGLGYLMNYDKKDIANIALLFGHFLSVYAFNANMIDLDVAKKLGEDIRYLIYRYTNIDLHEVYNDKKN